MMGIVKKKIILKSKGSKEPSTSKSASASKDTKTDVLVPESEIKGIKNKLKDKFFPEKTFLINMELRNGMHRTVLIKPSKDHFKFMGGTYLIDSNLKYYKVDSKIWALDYHQDFAMPIKREIPLSEIRKAIDHSGVCEVESATNPSTLEHFIKARVAEGVMKGAPIDEEMKKIKLMCLIITVAVVAHLLLFMFKTGMLSSVKIPGLG